MKYITILIISIFWVSVSHAGVIFEDNFDATSDWWTTMRAGNYQCVDTGCTEGAVAPPVKWSWYYSDEIWNPYSTSPTVGSKPSMIIDGTNHYGASGKAFTVWNESAREFISDGILAKHFSTDYNEIYVQLKIKFQPGFQHFWTVGQNASMIKIFRAMHYDGSGSPFLFFEGGNVAPAYIFDTVNSEYGNMYATALRCDPQATQYRCPNNSVGYTKYAGEPTWANSLGDGEWHTLAWHLKMNSNLDVKDGIVQFWFDDVLQLDKIDMDWLRSGGDSQAGWNVIAIGGNAFNNYKQINSPYTFVSGAEQWYAIDDVVVSTTSIPDDYVIGSSSIPGFCGYSNDLALSSAPTTGLCSAGTASSVTGSGPWSWSCAGSGGGSTASCSASLQGQTVTAHINGRINGSLK